MSTTDRIDLWVLAIVERLNLPVGQVLDLHVDEFAALINAITLECKAELRRRK